MLADLIKKILNPKAAPTRAQLERAISQAQAERERAENAVVELNAARRSVLLHATDTEAADHDAKLAGEQRAADRATALIEELEGKLAEVADREREEAIAAERKATEAKVAAGIAALKDYEAVARRVAEIVSIVAAGEEAAKAFSDAHPDQTPVIGPEAQVRWTAPVPRRDLKRERVELWVRADGTPVPPDSDLAARIQPAIGKGSLFTEAGYRHEFTRRLFEQVSFVPAFPGAATKRLADTVTLPGLLATDPAICDPERRLPRYSVVSEVETEIVPAEASPAVGMSQQDETEAAA